jgi:hypothetical protein
MWRWRLEGYDYDTTLSSVAFGTVGDVVGSASKRTPIDAHPAVRCVSERWDGTPPNVLQWSLSLLTGHVFPVRPTPLAALEA